MENTVKNTLWSEVSDNVKTLVGKVSDSDAGIIVVGAILIGGILYAGKLMLDAMAQNRVCRVNN